MKELTPRIVKKYLLERIRKRMQENPEDVMGNLVDAYCIDCVNFRQTLEAQKNALFGAIDEDLGTLDQFLGQVEDSLLQLLEEEEEQDEEE